MNKTKSTANKIKFFHNIKSIISWTYTLGKKLLARITRNISIGTIASLISEVSMLIAFLLPLKILLLVGTTNTPSYFSFFSQSFSKENLILILSIISILFYLVHLFAQRVVNKNIKEGLTYLSSKVKEASLFTNHDRIIIQSLERITKIFSSLIFILLSWIILSVMYFEVFLFLMFYTLLMSFFFNVSYHLSTSYYVKLVENINSSIKIIGGIGFLLTFFLIIVDILYYDTSKDLILIIITFMISKQVTNHYARVVLDIASLIRYQDKIDILFFDKNLAKTNQQKKHEAFWNLCKKENQSNWIYPLVQKYIAIQTNETIDIVWCPLEITNVVAFEVIVKNEQIKQIDSYIIKLFNLNRVGMSNNEANILLLSENLPSLPLIAMTQIENYPCHIFKKGNRKNTLVAEVKQIEMVLREKLLNLTLTQDLLEDYEKYHCYLWDRLDTTFISRIKMVANEKNKLCIETFEKELHILKRELKNLPLRLVNNFEVSENMFYENADDAVLLNWGNYAIEPLGAGWPVDEKYMKKLELLVKKGLKNYIGDIDNIQLSVFTFELDRLYKKQLYSKTFEPMQKILDILQKEKGQ